MQWRLGVVGSPIAHSLSPQLHQAGLDMCGLAGTSRRVDLTEAHAGRLAGLMGSEFDALSVTMPLKSAAASLCDELDDTARSLGVVSSLWWRDGHLEGAATDGPGFVDSLRGVFNLEVADAHVVVLGAGGAARAIVASLVAAGVHSVSVLGRNPANVGRIVARYPNVVDHAILYRPVDLIVNTTPVLGRPQDAAVMQGVSRQSVAVDITYEPRRSPWLALHEDNGCRATNGLAMLAYQAARQMNWWFDAALDGAELLKVIT